MESERLRQFCVIADSGSLTKASEVLNISLGGLSKSMKSLEKELGFPLFVSVGRGLVLSERGMMLYPKARRILESIAELTLAEEPLKSFFRVGVLEVFSADFMSSIIAEKFNGQVVEVIESGPGELESMVIDGKIDCALTYLPFLQRGIEILKVGTFELRAFATKVLAANRSINEIPFIVPATGLDFNPLGIKERDGWPEDTAKRIRIHRTNMLSTALGMARRSLGAVYMPDFVAYLHNETQINGNQLLPVRDSAKIPKLKREAFLVKKLHSAETKEMKKLAAAVREHLRLRD